MECEYCSEEHKGIYGSKRFCKQKCARGYATKEKRKEINKKVSKKLKGRKMTDEQKEKLGKARKLITTQQYNNKMSQSMKEWWRKRKETLSFEEQGLNTQREILLKECEHKCTECGQGEIWNGKNLTLEVHHIDGDKRNNIRKNKTILCPNCHSQTDKFGNYNKENKKKQRDSSMAEQLVYTQ